MKASVALFAERGRSFGDNGAARQIEMRSILLCWRDCPLSPGFQLKMAADRNGDQVSHN